MLRTRLWMGAVLIGLMAGVLVVDRPPAYPLLLALVVVAGLAAAGEMYRLLAVWKVRAWPLVAGALAMLLANWPAHVWPGLGRPWDVVLGTLVVVLLAAFLAEMAAFAEPGGGVIRLALTFWAVAYLGLLPSFLVQLRWLGGAGAPGRGAAAVVLAVFVPKCCDIGAYFTGRLLGRHPMSPVLSPKKTWEGFAGGLALSALVAVAINRLAPVPALRGGATAAAAFGLVLGGVGVLGDLAESFVKRDSRQKDASQVVPGFGGVLDVIDSVVFAAPVAYVWLNWGE
jgi:phosphatidate cytidylyltransferase